MRLGLRGRLFLISVMLVLSTVGVGAIYFERQVRGWTQGRMESELGAHARLGCALARDVGASALAPFSEQLAETVNARVTVIDAAGVVLGDSEKDFRRMDNHGSRPEVIAARARGTVGVALRHSETVNVTMLYAAVPCEIAGGTGTLRVARPLRALQDAVRALRVVFVLAALSGLALAVFMSAVTSHMLSRALRVVVGEAQKLTGASGARLSLLASDEFGGLAGSFNKLAGELERTMETLAQERSRFEAVLEGLADAVLSIDEDRRITMVNRAARSLFKLPATTNGRELVDVIRIPALHELVREGLEGRSGTAEFEVIGPPRHVVVARVARLPENRGVVVAVQDVTDLRRLESVRRDFVANVSHELRTPVGIVRANAETLLDGALERPELARRFLDAQLRASERLSNLVNDLLEISRIESGRYDLDPDHVRLEPLTSKVMRAVDELAVKKNIQLTREVEPDLVVWGDARALDHVLLNLVENAVKYTQVGGHVALVASFVEGEREGDARVRLEIRDDGPGIEAIHRPRIFERFYRVDPGRSRSVGGTGLGLAIVKHLVDAMGGSVGVGPIIPRGSCFWVELPVTETDSAS
ncbi:MAG: PAS domain-containing protein [Myxococcales bacterium]|nr:PAS domain-containing protein [Myxococcales bacterium]MCB9756054.1 PAS domain-containing protein [Myxococcales bacterium]